MQTFTLSLLLNIVLVLSLVLIVFLPRVSKLYKERKKLRETRLEKEIKRIVVEYLEQLKSD